MSINTTPCRTTPTSTAVKDFVGRPVGLHHMSCMLSFGPQVYFSNFPS